MSKPIESLSRGIQEQLEGMLDRRNAVKSYLARVVYKKYQKAQLQRWITENASEGNKWKELNSIYAKQKRKRFASYPGKGSKMMIATNRLYQSVIGRGSSEHRMIITNTSITVGTSVPYAEYASKVRPTFKFGEKFETDIRKGLADFLIKGIFGG